MALSRRTVLHNLAALAFATQTGYAIADSTPHQRVEFVTSEGNFIVELDADKAPLTVSNFLQYVADQHYDSTVFHRVIDDFMIQGGGFTADMQQKPTRAPIQLEAHNGLKNDRYTIAMARTADPHSATSQFFINVANNDTLNAPNPDGYGYTVFGKVVQGQAVIDKIRAVATSSRGMHQNVPISPVTITSARLLKQPHDE